MKIYLVLAGVIFGLIVSIIFQAFHQNTIRIKIRDNSGSICKLDKVSFIFSEKTISLSGNQFKNRDSTSEYLVTILAEPNESNKIEYFVQAEYLNCAPVKGEKNIVENGDILYEDIENSKIHHALRN